MFQQTVTKQLLWGNNMTLSKITKPITDKDRDNKINGLIDEFDSLAGVATTGSYNDLTNKPTIPDAQVQSNWNETDTSSKAYIKNKPTIPTVNNATLTIQKNGTTVKTFTANASSNVTCNITVPTDTQDLTNGAGYTTNTGTVTSVNGVTPVNGDVSIPIPTVNNATLTIQKNGSTVKTFTANASSNVTCNITVPTKTSDLTNDSGYTTNTGTITGITMNGVSKGTSGVVNLGTVITDVSGKANTADLATVATSGSYNDLSNKPTIPAAQVQSDWNETDSTSKAYIKNKPNITNTVDQTYDGTSTNAQSGVAIENSRLLKNKAGGVNAIAIEGTATKSTAIAIGVDATASEISAIQLGKGTNNAANTLSVGFANANHNYQLLDGSTGLIPDARLSSNIARTSAIPTVNNATLTIQKNGTTVKTFTANASSNVTCNITVPTKTSDITNDSGYTTNTGTITGITMNGVSKGTSGVVDLGTVITSHQDISGKANTADLATVATSGSYNDLSNKPTIPTVGNGTITITQDGTTKGTFTTNQSGDSTIELDGGGGRNIGEIVSSTIPLSDAGLHLLDGSLLQYASYKDFIDYIASIYSANSNYFCSESDWQTSVTNYGVCGKFVYNSTNNTVRLPKITGFTEGAISVTTLGDLTEAGLPDHNHTHYARARYGADGGTTGAFWCRGDSGTGYTTGEFSYASESNSIYGNSTTVQPQSIKVLYYIVIANSTKTEIEVDIDEIATDLNGKADTDLSNAIFSSSVKNTIFSFGIPKFASSININPSGATSGSYTTTAKGYIYVDFSCYAKTMSLYINNQPIHIRTATGSHISSLNGLYPVESGVTVSFANGYMATTTYSTQGIYFVPIQAN